MNNDNYKLSREPYVFRPSEYFPAIFLIIYVSFFPFIYTSFISLVNVQVDVEVRSI